LGHLNSSKAITLFTVTDEASIKRVDSEDTALLRLPMLKIRYCGEIFGLEGKEIVEVAGGVLDWSWFKLLSINHSHRIGTFECSLL